jgi:flagellar motor switch protein FliN
MSLRNLTDEQIEAMLNLSSHANSPQPNQGVKKAHFSTLLPQPVDEEQSDISSLHEVEVELQVELGETSINLRDVLALQPDKVIPLNRLAGDMVDLKVNHIWLAYVEVLVLKETLGVRITSFKGDENFTGRGAK